MANPLWILIFVTLLAESAVCLVLVLPLPGNSVRGFVVTNLSKLWEGSSYLRYTCTLICVLNMIMFATDMRTLYFLPPVAPEMPGGLGVPGYCEARLVRFRTERNAYISGFSLFIYFVMRRLLEIQTQLYLARKAAKEQEREKKAK